VTLQRLGVGFPQKICYRFRPVGRNPELTLQEVMLFKIAPKDKPIPPPAQMRMLADDEPWTTATELSYLAGVYDQDQANLPPVQQGLRDMGDAPVHFSRVEELRCRNLHRMIDEYIKRSVTGGRPRPSPSSS